jgi:hypothetical protein
MSVVYLLLGGPDEDKNGGPDDDENKWYLGGIITPDGYHVFEIYDFLQIALISHPKPQKSRKYVQQLWQKMCRRHSQFMYVQGTLELAIPSPNMRKTTPEKGATPGTTVAGLRAILDVLGRNQVTDATRKTLEDIFARYAAGDRSMLVFVNVNDEVHPQIPSFNYNFQPPTASNEEVIEYDFTTTDDHMV